MFGRRLAPAGYLAICLCLAAAFVILLPAAASASEPRAMRGVALIIGNSAYEHLTPLENPETDADAIEKLFDDLGFETYDATDADLKKLRRTIDRFIEDAEGVDVALVYYAGHGVEAGGENYLIPVDADISSLDDAGEKLVALSELMRRLREAASLSFVLLDACRDNPFPPGSTIRATVNAAPLPVSASGLGETRTMKQFRQPGTPARPAATNDSLGTLIGFSAEPGQRALDGEPGGNSPYATAVLRHVPAMAGEEISTVMRMVAEEVYLKTDGRQRPWVNENLRRLVFLGSTPPPVEGVEGDILRERRQLLINIAAIPSAERSQIEKVAREGKVSMDWVYAMVRALGDKAPKDPAELEAKLKEQVEKIKTLQGQRDAVFKSDPEIARLSALADQAAREGAVETALKLHEQAKARVEEVSKTVEDVEASLKARRFEFGKVYARSAKENFAVFKYEQAAADYEKAFREVERWDDFAAWSYRGNQAVALYMSGWNMGVTKHLHQAADLAREVIRMSEQTKPSPDSDGLSQRLLGNVLAALGQRTNDTALFIEALAAFEAALTVYVPGLYPDEHYLVLWSVAATKRQIAQRRDPKIAQIELPKTLALYDELLKLSPHGRDPDRWVDTLTQKAVVLTELAWARNDAQTMRDAIRMMTEAQDAIILRPKLEDVGTNCALASAWSELGRMVEDRAALEKAEFLFARCLSLSDRSRDPMFYLGVLVDRALNFRALFLLTGDPAWLDRSVPGLRDALAELDGANLPFARREVAAILASVRVHMGRANKDTSALKEAVELYQAALELCDPGKDPELWADNLSKMADARRNLGEAESAPTNLARALDEQEQALRAVTSERFPETTADIRKRTSFISAASSRLGEMLPDDTAISLLRRAASILEKPQPDGPLASVEAELGRRYYLRAIRSDDVTGLREAISHYRRSLVADAQLPEFDVWNAGQSNLGLALIELARIEKNTRLLEQAIEPFKEAIKGYAANDLASVVRDGKRLAETYDTLATSGSMSYLNNAVDAWTGVVARLPSDASPAERAYVLGGQARAFSNLAYYTNGDKTTINDKAIAAFRLAIAAQPRAADETRWASNTRALAEMLRFTGENTNDKVRLQEALGLYRDLSGPGRAAGTERDRDQLSEASTHVLLARNGDKDGWQKAVAQFEPLLGRDAASLEKAASWSHVAAYVEALRHLGYVRQQPETIRRADEILDAFLSAQATTLTADVIEHLRLHGAENDLFLGDVTSDTAALGRSALAYRELADSPLTKANAPWVNYLNNRAATAHAIAGEIGGQSQDWRTALDLMRKVAANTPRQEIPAARAQVDSDLAFAISRASRAGVIGNGELADAVSLARNALTEITKASPGDIAGAQSSLCTAQIELGRATENPKPIEDGIVLCRQAAVEIDRQNRPWSAARVRKTVSYAEALLAKM